MFESRGWNELGEALDRLLAGIVHVENERELGDHKYVGDVLIHPAEFDAPTFAGVARVGRDENADSSTVEIGNMITAIRASAKSWPIASR